MPPQAKALAARVEKWFRSHARDLPWRKTRDGYAVWISEVMLQQTQVKTVIPFWERWMKLFPNVAALADAPEERVLKAWEGLGYYSRARNLQKAAQQVCARHGGKFPAVHEQVLELPGVGRYTAGAICSIAFGQPTPILDGNVARVLARLFLVEGSVKQPATQKRLWPLSAALVEAAGDCSALNQGLMELGAMVCLPRAPLCLTCPVQRDCQAFGTGRVEEFPTRAPGPEMRTREFIALILRRRGEVLIRRRGAGVVNGGLWEFPNFEVERKENLAGRMSELPSDLRELKTIKHTITRNRITLRAWGGKVRGEGRTLAREWQSEWRPIEELQDLPFSSAHAKLRGLVERMEA